MNSQALRVSETLIDDYERLGAGLLGMPQKDEEVLCVPFRGARSRCDLTPCLESGKLKPSLPRMVVKQ